MSVLLFCCQSDAIRKRIKGVIETQTSGVLIEIHNTLESFTDRLKKPRYDLDVMILVAQTQHELADMASVQHLFDHIPIILILPDRERDTLSRGLRFYPRYISHIDSNYNDVGDVLGKILNYMNLSKKLQFEGGEKTNGRISRKNGSGRKSHGRKGRQVPDLCS